MLTPRDHMVLNLAGRRYRHGGAKVADVLHETGMSEAQWAQMLDVQEQAIQAAKGLHRSR